MSAGSAEGRVQVVLESESLGPDGLEQLKRLLVLQQACPMAVTLDPLQTDLFGP